MTTSDDRLRSPSVSAAGETRLLLMIFYKGPYERISHWLWKVEHQDEDEIFDNSVTPGSARDRLAAWFEKRDTAWREKYVRSGKSPHDRWKRII